MKPLLLIFAVIWMASCNSKPMDQANFIVKTTVPIKAGQVDRVLDLFKATNPELVKDQDDWVKAVFSVHEETNEVQVLAYWKDKDSYLYFSSSEKFLSTMSQFRPHFAGQPVIKINRILYEM
ncbi:MAG: hypothetical protein HKN68_08335 [Saprospiraceae bacterium]|nr:hypothetical protein [Saprospiraceae bacterium]